MLQARDAELQAAMTEMLGCGSTNHSISKQTIRQVLQPIWNALPKNRHGRVEWKLLRYTAHRYFMQQSSLMVKGFEPTRVVNRTNLGSANILDQHLPALADVILGGQQHIGGFDLEDAVSMVATLEQLILDSEADLLVEVSKYVDVSLNTASLTHKQFYELLEMYMVHWMIGNDDETLRTVLKDPKELNSLLPHWNEIQQFVAGMVRSHDFSHQHQLLPGKAGEALTQKYTFDDAHDVVGRITKSFSSYWETECQAIKTTLVDMDKTGTGRVLLSDFYGSNFDGEWRFGESEAYLRDLGALDDSSWRGPQVIIPNYLQAASNCIVSADHYLVCCVNECEDILGELELAVGAPTAGVQQIMWLVGNMTNYNDTSPNLEGALTAQLERIAEVHNGQVPLHGRLFAQWLHFVFPRECPFPHLTGSVTHQSPVERGDDMLAHPTEVQKYAEISKTVSKSDRKADPAQEEEDLMSQWTQDEELVYDMLPMEAPWEYASEAAFGGAAIVLLLAALAMLLKGTTRESMLGLDTGSAAKLHCV